MDVYDPQHIKFALMIGIHHITALSGEIFQTITLSLDERVAHGVVYHIPAYCVPVFLCEFFRVILHIYEAKEIINYERK